MSYCTSAGIFSFSSRGDGSWSITIRNRKFIPIDSGQVATLASMGADHFVPLGWCPIEGKTFSFAGLNPPPEEFLFDRSKIPDHLRDDDQELLRDELTSVILYRHVDRFGPIVAPDTVPLFPEAAEDDSSVQPTMVGVSMVSMNFFYLGTYHPDDLSSLRPAQWNPQIRDVLSPLATLRPYGMGDDIPILREDFYEALLL